jgi:hypothetical protein
MGGAKLGIVLAVAGSIALLTLPVAALARRKRTVLSAVVAVAGFAVIGFWMWRVWRGTGLLVFGLVLVAWIASPFVYRVFLRSME